MAPGAMGHGSMGAMGVMGGWSGGSAEQAERAERAGHCGPLEIMGFEGHGGRVERGKVVGGLGVVRGGAGMGKGLGRRMGWNGGRG